MQDSETMNDQDGVHPYAIEVCAADPEVLHKKDYILKNKRTLDNLRKVGDIQHTPKQVPAGLKLRLSR